MKGARSLENMPRMFSKFSGQAINFDKSGIAFSLKTNPITISQIVSILNIKKLGLQDEYLGVPLLIQRNKVETFSGLMDNFDKRLATWKGKYVNQPGRTVLTQSVLGTMASHHLAVFPMPKKLTDRMDAIQRRFRWNKKGSNRRLFFRNWDNITKPIVLGGLNIKKTEHLNSALLAKLAWRLVTEQNVLWTRIYKESIFLIVIHFIMLRKIMLLGFGKGFVKAGDY